VALLESRGGRLASRLVSQFYPLHAAVMENDLEAVRTAIAAGANLAATEYHGLTPLHVACSVAGRPVIQVGPTKMSYNMKSALPRLLLLLPRPRRPRPQPLLGNRIYPTRD
jgi:hypothetical protein